jgi:hypothetical protein
MRKLSELIVAILVSLLLAGPVAATPVFVPADAIASLADVDPSDGISEAEAKMIAETYFNKHVGCGTYEGVSDSSESWIVEGKTGYSGDPISGFLISKTTGEVISTVGPSYARPSDMLLLGPNNSFKPSPHQSGA